MKAVASFFDAAVFLWPYSGLTSSSDRNKARKINIVRRGRQIMLIFSAEKFTIAFPYTLIPAAEQVFRILLPHEKVLFRR